MRIDTFNQSVEKLIEHFLRPHTEASLPPTLRLRKVLDRLDHPERHLPPCIHITGTNGKGSTIAILKALCESQGMRVHTFTSPHLISYVERIVLDGVPVSNNKTSVGIRLKQTKAVIAKISKRWHGSSLAASTTSFKVSRKIGCETGTPSRTILST